MSNERRKESPDIISPEDAPVVQSSKPHKSYESFALPAESTTRHRKNLNFHRHHHHLPTLQSMSDAPNMSQAEVLEMTVVASDSSLPSSLPSSQLHSLDVNANNNNLINNSDRNNNEDTSQTEVNVPESHINLAFEADDKEGNCGHQVPCCHSTHHHHQQPVGVAVRVRKLNLSYREKILSVSALTSPTAFQPVFVLNGLSLTVPAGSIYGLLGPSGCGKTSLLRCM